MVPKDTIFGIEYGFTGIVYTYFFETERRLNSKFGMYRTFLRTKF